MRSPLQVLLTIPNIIGYVRILLLIIGCLFVDAAAFLTFFICSIGLDFFDGFFARKYNQETVFGEWLDVVIDLLTRGMLWCWALPNVGFLIMAFEFLVFVCLHSHIDTINKGWQEKQKIELHWLAAKSISKGFRTIPGAVAIVGLWALPLWTYMSTKCSLHAIMQSNFGLSADGAASFHFFITAVLITSRIHCCFVESCILKNHLTKLIEKDC